MNGVDFCYRPAGAVEADSSVDPARVFAVDALAIKLARVGTQTHISFMDLLRLAPSRGWEAMTTTAIRHPMKMAKRLMGLMR